MWMVQQILSPCMQKRKEANARAQMLRIGRDGQQSLRTGLEQKRVEDTLVLQCQSVELLWRGEHDVVVINGQQFAPAFLDPFGPLCLLALRAMAVSAGGVNDALVGGLTAALDISAADGGGGGVQTGRP